MIGEKLDNLQIRIVGILYYETNDVINCSYESGQSGK